MSLVLVLLLLSQFYPLSSVAQDMDATYDHLINEIINFNELRVKIRNSLSDNVDGRYTALKMFDASTKIPNGLLARNLFDLGNFDECYGIEFGDIYGKYCLGTVPLTELSPQYFEDFRSSNRDKNFSKPEQRQIGPFGETTGFFFAACVPSNWSVEDIPGQVKYTENYCYSKATELGLSTGAIVVIIVLALFGAIIVTSTIYETFLYYRKRKAHHELLIAFSFLTNGRKLFQASTNPDQLLCLNGIKALSMVWVVIGHSYSNIRTAPLSNYPGLQNWLKDPANMVMIGATVNVDSFLLVTGLVTVYTFMNSRAKGAKFNVFLYYIHRYLRLTPVLLIAVLVHIYLLNYFGNGPLWRVVDNTLVKPCEVGWWSTILYINNYLDHGACIPQTWYLSVDMQLFVLSPIVLLPLTKWPKIGLGMLGFLAIAGCVVPFAVSYSHNFQSMINNNDSRMYNNIYYYQTYARFGPYVIGMILGYFVYKIKKCGMKIRFHYSIVLLLWLVFLTGLTACVYAGYPLHMATEEDTWGNAMFLAFDRPGFATCVAGIIFLCVSGYAGPVDYFLSLPILQLLTKLSYSMYIVHQSIIIARYSSMKNTIKFSDAAMAHGFWGDFMFTSLISVFMYLTFESPVPILEKYIFRRGLPKRSQNGKKSEAQC